MGLVTVRTAAQRLGVSYSTFKRWVHLGQVRTTITEGGHHRVSDVEIDRMLAHQPDRGSSKQSTSHPEDSLAGLSARNRLRGIVEEVRVDGLLAQVRLRVAGQVLTAVITSDAVEDLHLKRGDEALAVIKSTEVMVARSGAPVEQRRRNNKKRR